MTPATSRVPFAPRSWGVSQGGAFRLAMATYATVNNVAFAAATTTEREISKIASAGYHPAPLRQPPCHLEPRLSERAGAETLVRKRERDFVDGISPRRFLALAEQDEVATLAYVPLQLHNLVLRVLAAAIRDLDIYAGPVLGQRRDVDVPHGSADRQYEPSKFRQAQSNGIPSAKKLAAKYLLLVC